MRAARKKKTVRVSPAANRLATSKYMGKEPVYDSKRPATDGDFAFVLSWYHNAYEQNQDKAKEFILTFLKERKIDASVVRKVAQYPANKIPLSIGWTCRQLSIQSAIPKQYAIRALNFIKNLPTIEAVKEESNVIAFNVQDRVREKTSNIVAEFEGFYDDFIAANFESDIVPYEKLQAFGATAQNAKRLIELYSERLAEIEAAVKGKDDDLNEAYAVYKKTDLKKIIAWYKSVISSAERLVTNKKVERKPRAKKEKSATALIKKVQYKKEDTEFKLVSVDPINIVGAQSLWVFNTKTRMLSVYYSENEKGLSIKGTTLQGFNEATSETKKLRKPESVLQEVLTGGRVAIRKLMSNLTTKPSPTTGRINADTILLKATK